MEANFECKPFILKVQVFIITDFIRWMKMVYGAIKRIIDVGSER
jgi:hypothetical protein